MVSLRFVEDYLPSVCEGSQGILLRVSRKHLTATPLIWDLFWGYLVWIVSWNYLWPEVHFIFMRIFPWLENPERRNSFILKPNLNPGSFAFCLDNSAKLKLFSFWAHLTSYLRRTPDGRDGFALSWKLALGCSVLWCWGYTSFSADTMLGFPGRGPGGISWALQRDGFLSLGDIQMSASREWGVGAGMTNFAVGRISIHFSSDTQLSPTLWDPMNRSTPGLPVHHQLPEFT